MKIYPSIVTQLFEKDDYRAKCKNWWNGWLHALDAHKKSPDTVSLHKRKQLMLYGPPGCGKTYFVTKVLLGKTLIVIEF